MEVVEVLAAVKSLEPSWSAFSVGMLARVVFAALMLNFPWLRYLAVPLLAGILWLLATSTPIERDAFVAVLVGIGSSGLPLGLLLAEWLLRMLKIGAA
ncbi:MAG: hypothetical protein MUC44_08875 [Beijerinckiaceae bacterium]|jgi:hypothetical protein|nr:hypothetical protein [Beijerinckiaceae bacterium]